MKNNDTLYKLWVEMEDGESGYMLEVGPLDITLDKKKFASLNDDDLKMALAWVKNYSPKKIKKEKVR